MSETVGIMKSLKQLLKRKIRRKITQLIKLENLQCGDEVEKARADWCRLGLEQMIEWAMDEKGQKGKESRDE